MHCVGSSFQIRSLMRQVTHPPSSSRISTGPASSIAAGAVAPLERVGLADRLQGLTRLDRRLVDEYREEARRAAGRRRSLRRGGEVAHPPTDRQRKVGG